MCICMNVSMYVLFCHVLYVLYVYCIYIYVYNIFMYMYIGMCVYMYVYLCTYMLLSMLVLVHTFVCIKVIQLIVCLLDIQVAYLSVWHCYLCSILAFSFEIVKLNTTTCTKSSTQVIKINLGNINSLFLTLIANNSGCMYLFIRINSD